jgi:hypothetical protein
MSMRKISSAAVVACLLSSVAAANAPAAPPEALQPMAFLAGHCWKGEFPGGKMTDEHCFAWMYDGKALRDTHTVRAPDRPDYVGETTYYWDSAAKRVEFIYLENAGGVSRGTMEATPGTLVFPPTQYVADGQSMTYRVRWTLIDARTYEAWSEAQGKDGWATMFKLVLKQVS